MCCYLHLVLQWQTGQYTALTLATMLSLVATGIPIANWNLSEGRYHHEGFPDHKNWKQSIESWVW